jgi:CBS domain-containing protein
MCSLVLTTKALSACGVLRLPSPDLERPAYRVTNGGAAAAILPLRALGGSLAIRLRPSDPAQQAMLDFARIHAVTVRDDRGIESALDDMWRAGVRALLALRDGQVIGLVTDADIEGGRTARFLEAHPELQREQVPVREILTPCEEIPSVDWETIRGARVSDLLELFETAGYAHLAVFERANDESALLRGLVSRARLERQLDFW